jgi:uncharacterized protein (TIGR02145 family)
MAKFEIYLTQSVTAEVTVTFTIESDQSEDEVLALFEEQAQDWTRLARLDPESDDIEGYVQDTFHYELNYEGDDGGDVEVSVTEIDPQPKPKKIADAKKDAPVTKITTTKTKVKTDSILMENNLVKDIDGNTYNVVKIGKQVWTIENLNVSKYRNGDVIPQVQDKGEWATLKTGAWCYYENKDENGTTYGKLYNWFAVNDPRGLAPEGFHIPSDKEWKTLTTNLGGKEINNLIPLAGGKMKEKGKMNWEKPNKGATNSSGFTGLPAGNRNIEGMFISKGLNAFWWSSSEVDSNNAWFRRLSYNYDYVVFSDTFKTQGFSIRCIKD